MRVPFSTQAPLTLPGMLSTAGQCDQSSCGIGSLRFMVIHSRPFRRQKASSTSPYAKSSAGNLPHQAKMIPCLPLPSAFSSPPSKFKSACGNGGADRATTPEGPLYIVSTLKGAFIFVADLVRALNRSLVRIEFMAISSYGNQKTSSGQVKVTRDLDVNIEGQQVLIVEDIIDSGVTLSYLKRLLEQRHPKSLAIATLLDKPERRLGRWM